MRHGKLDRGSLVAAYRYRGSLEWICGRGGPARKWWSRSIALAAQLGAHYELAATRLEIGLRTREREPLERAAATFAAVGARGDVLRAVEVLGESPPAPADARLVAVP